MPNDECRAIYIESLSDETSYLFLNKKETEGTPTDVNNGRVLVIKPRGGLVVHFRQDETALAFADSMSELEAQFGFTENQLIPFTESEMRMPGYISPADAEPTDQIEQTCGGIVSLNPYYAIATSCVYQNAMQEINAQPLHRRKKYADEHFDEWAGAIRAEIGYTPTDLESALAAFLSIAY